MKKRIVSLVIAIGTVLLVTIPVSATVFTYNLNITNSGSALTNVPVIASIDNTALISQGIMSSTGLDAQVQDVGTALPSLVCGDKTLFVGNVPHGDKTFTYVTGQTPAASMPIIVGDGGYVTTPYNVDLEPGSYDFELDISGHINTTAGVNKFIIDHPGEIVCFVSASVNGTITATVFDGSGDHPLTLSGISSGDYDISLVRSNGMFTFTVGSNSDSVTGIGTVPDTTSTWTWDENNVMSYMNYINIKIFGTPSGTITAVRKLNNSDLSKIADYEIADNYMVRGLATDGSYIYAAIYDTDVFDNYKIIKLDSSLNLEGTYDTGVTSSPTTPVGDVTRLWCDGTYLYACDPDNGTYGTDSVLKIQTSDMTLVDSYSGTAYGDCISSFDGYGSHLYVGWNNGASNNILEKINTSTMGEASHVIIGTHWATCIRCTPYTVYCQLNIFALNINSYDINDLTPIDSYDAGAGNSLGCHLSLDATNVYGFNRNGTVGTTYPVEIAKIQQTTPMTELDTLNYTTVGIDNTVHGINPDASDGFLYVSTEYTGLTKIQTSDMTAITSDFLPSYCDSVTDGSYVYTGQTALTFTISTQLLYNPRSIISGTVLPDLDSTQDGVITWGTNLSGVTTSVTGGTPVPTSTPSNWVQIVSGNANVGYWHMINGTPTAPSHLYTELGTGFLGGSFIVSLANLWDMPLAVILFPYCFGISLLLGLGAYVLTMGRKQEGMQFRPWQGSTVVMTIVCTLSMTYFVIAGGGAIPGWTLVPFLVMSIATIMFRQNRQGAPY